MIECCSRLSPNLVPNPSPDNCSLDANLDALSEAHAYAVTLEFADRPNVGVLPMHLWPHSFALW